MKFEPPNHGNVAGTPEQTDDGPCRDLQDCQSHVLWNEFSTLCFKIYQLILIQLFTFQINKH